MLPPAWVESQLFGKTLSGRVWSSSSKTCTVTPASRRACATPSHSARALGDVASSDCPAGTSRWNALSAVVAGLGMNRSARIRMTVDGACALTVGRLEHRAFGPDGHLGAPYDGQLSGSRTARACG